MANYGWKVTYNGMALETLGLVVHNPSIYFTSALAITTYGFIYGVADIWTLIPCEHETVWTLCECDLDCA